MEKREGSIHFGLKTIIPWGKRFKGMTIAQLLTTQEGVEYIKWMYEQTDNMVVEPEVLVKLYDDGSPKIFNTNNAGVHFGLAKKAVRVVGLYGTEMLLEFIEANKGKPIIIK